MTLEIFLRYIHFISVFTIVSTISIEHLLIKKEMTPTELKKLARVDAFYGISVITLLVAGLSLWLGGIGKPTEYYSHNWIFHLKLTLFVIIGLLSIYPTVFFIKGGKRKEELISVPKMIIMFIRLELFLVFIIPFLAGLMAKGVGLMDD